MKQVKGKKGKKNFLRSKKTLVAAAMAALIALAGVTYAWFTWSVGLTGGTLKADYVQINADFGAYVRIQDLFYKYSFWFDGDNPYTPSNTQGSSKFIPKDPSFEIVLTAGNAAIPAGNEEFFIPFAYIQGDKISGLKTYLETTKFEPQQDEFGNIPVPLEPLVGKTLAEVLKGVRAADANGQYVPFFPVIENYDPADPTLLLATYELKPLADEGNFLGLLDGAYGNTAPGRDAASVINNWFQHEVPTSKVDVGYAIKNLGAACYINLPDPMKSVKISQSTKGAYYDAGIRYDANDDGYVHPTWGVAQYGNYIDGYLDGFDGTAPNGTFEATDRISGWETNVPSRLYSTGMFEDPISNTYNAIYAQGDNSVVPSQLGIPALFDGYSSYVEVFGVPSDYGIKASEIKADYPTKASLWTGLAGNEGTVAGWVGFGAFYKACPEFKFPIDLINKIYAFSCNRESLQTTDVPDASWLSGNGLYNETNGRKSAFTGDSLYFDIYPLTVTSDTLKATWKWQDNADWKVSVSRSFAGGAGADVYTDFLTIAQNLYAGKPVQSIFDAGDLGNLALMAAGDFDMTYDGLTAPTTITQAVAYLLNLTPPDPITSAATGWDGTSNYSKVDTKIIPEYDVAIAKDPTTGLQVLHVQGAAFTYKTNALAPTIYLRYRLYYGAYLDNRFVGSELYLDSKGVVAVQDTPEAALDVFVTKAGLTGVDVSFFQTGGQWQSVALWDVKGLPRQYMNSIVTP